MKAGILTENLWFEEAKDVETVKGSCSFLSEKYLSIISGSKKDFVLKGVLELLCMVIVFY